MSTALHTVHVRVNDAATGQPTPVRIRFTGPGGEYFAPFGRLTDFAGAWGEDVGGNLRLEDRCYAYIDGTCEIGLPAGPLTVEISKGPEYLPLRQELTLGPGKLALRFAVSRWVNLREQGWYSGDVRAHFLTPHAALLEAAAEDVAVANVLAFQGSRPDAGTGKSYPILPNLLAFSGQRPALEASGHLVAVNTYNTHPVLGNLALLHCHRVIYPLAFGGDAGPDNWTLADWCDQCHRKGGLVVWGDVLPPKPEPDSSEALADLILGKVDARATDGFAWQFPDPAPDWYRLLNCGFRIPLVGASGKDSNNRALGETRTYARLAPGAGLRYDKWTEAVRAGRTFVTNGPLLCFTVDGQDPGAVLDLPAPPPRLHVRAEARSLVPFAALELLVNGSVAARAGPSGSPTSAVLETDCEMAAGGWLAVRCGGKTPGQEGRRPVFAQTAPVYVQVAGRAPPADPAAAADLISRLDQGLSWVEHRGRFENDRQRQKLAGIFRAAREKLGKRGNG